MKNILSRIVITFFVSWSFFSLSFAATPDINCGELPGCSSGASISESTVYSIIGGVIAVMIKYVAVVAVIAVMIGGIMYLLSSGEEEKTKRAKNIIIWALVGVFVSVLAWSLINILNNFRI